MEVADLCVGTLDHDHRRRLPHHARLEVFLFSQVWPWTRRAVSWCQTSNTCNKRASSTLRWSWLSCKSSVRSHPPPFYPACVGFIFFCLSHSFSRLIFFFIILLDDLRQRGQARTRALDRRHLLALEYWYSMRIVSFVLFGCMRLSGSIGGTYASPLIVVPEVAIGKRLNYVMSCPDHLRNSRSRQVSSIASI